MDTITLELNPFIALTDEQFFQLCQHHSDYRFERTASGALIVMSPTEEKNKRNLEIALQLGMWNKQTKLVAFDLSGVLLPNGAERSPDAAWEKRTVECLTPEQRQKFLLYLLILSWSYALPVIR